MRFFHIFLTTSPYDGLLVILDGGIQIQGNLLSTPLEVTDLVSLDTLVSCYFWQVYDLAEALLFGTKMIQMINSRKESGIEIPYFSILYFAKICRVSPSPNEKGYIYSVSQSLLNPLYLFIDPPPKIMHAVCTNLEEVCVLVHENLCL